MTKVTLADVGSLIDATTAQTTINNNSAAIVAAVEETLSRDGSRPNQMMAPLDMNSNRILNLPDPIYDQEPVTLGTWNDLATAQGQVPGGGSTNWVLTKNSNASGDYSWHANQAAINIKTPEMYGAIGDGLSDDSIALQAWANALRDGGVGLASSAAGYGTTATIVFKPTSNTVPTQGPVIQGNLKLVGLGMTSDLLQIYNADTVTATQNFYYASFESIEVSNTTGSGDGVSLRGFWGSIGKIFARNVRHAVAFPSFLAVGIPDPFESMCNIGDVTGIDCRGYVIANLIGIGASITANNVRGTISNIANATAGSILCTGSMTVTGAVAYTGQGTGLTISFPPAPAIQTQPHEVFIQGWGDIDVAQIGVVIAQAEFANISGHRMNIEPPNSFGVVPSWPLVAYTFGATSNPGRVLDVYVSPYITIRPGVTAANIGTLFDFRNDPNISNLTVDATISDQTGLGILSTLGFAGIYKNINANATIKIIQNGTIVYDNTNISTFAGLPPASIGLRGTRRTITDSNTITFNALAAAGGSNVIGVICDGTNWRVG